MTAGKLRVLPTSRLGLPRAPLPILPASGQLTPEQEDVARHRESVARWYRENRWTPGVDAEADELARRAGFNLAELAWRTR